MRYTLQNSQLSIVIKESGAELCSIKSAEGTEYLWQADETYWNRHAPVLFPIVGSLKDNYFIVNGQEYSLGQHGFARDMDFEKIEEGSEKLIFQLKSNAETLTKYPFQFTLRIAYQLIGKKITVSWEAKNDGKDLMFFSIGAHPAFNVPVSGEGSKDGYLLDFGQKTTAATYLLNEKSEISNNTKQILNDQQQLIIDGDLFSKGALIFKNTDISYTALASPEGEKFIGVHFEGFPYLGIWSPKNNAPFVCIEPWHGIADNENANHRIEDKEGILKLLPNEKFEAGYVIEVY